MAKFGIALASGARGLGFESRHSDHEKRKTCKLQVSILQVFLRLGIGFFQFQELYLAVQATGITGKVAAGADYTVAWNHK